MSHFVTSLGNTKETVEELLRKYPRLRDNDNALIANIWDMEMRQQGLSQGQALKHFADGLLTSSETIRRTRQKLQEQHEELRGNKYTSRQVSGDEVRRQIHTV